MSDDRHRHDGAFGGVDNVYLRRNRTNNIVGSDIYDLDRDGDGIACD